MRIPTLIIGLGGVGCKIAFKTFEKIKEEDRDEIKVLGFDTNINDLGKLRVKYDKQLIQTSPAGHTVGSYLKQSIAKNDKEWHPMNNTILQKNFVDGAGQVRAVSRLALMAAMRMGVMQRVENTINELRQLNENRFQTNVRVIIISSHAGGTGSGIFLQVGLYLRDLLVEHFHINDALIRGIFLMPSVFTDILPPDQRRNVQANGYAAMKELNAIFRAAAGFKDDVNIEFEYKDNLLDEEGYSKAVMSAGKLPYDFCTIYERSNINNQQVRFHDYLDIVADATYLQAISPMSDDAFSLEDNAIRDTVRNEGQNRFTGAGISKLVYPYNDIKQYLIYKYSTYAISNKWLYIDDLFKIKVKQYRADSLRGSDEKPPALSEFFLNTLNNEQKESNSHSFWKMIYKQYHTYDDNNALDGNKYDDYLEEVENHLKGMIAENNAIVEASLFDIKKSKLKDRNLAKKEINKIESNLKHYRQAVLEQINHEKSNALNNIFYAPYNNKGKSGQKYSLNYWLIENEPMHIMSIRAFLYNLQREIRFEVDDLLTECTGLEEAMENYIKTFDEKETILVEDASNAFEKMEEKASKGIFFKSKKYEEFIETYALNASDQKGRIKLYADAKFMYTVYNELLKQIDEMVKLIEGFFRSIELIQKRIEGKIESLLEIHEKSENPTVKYVYASKEDKQHIWDNVRSHEAEDKMPDEMLEKLYLGFYNHICESVYRGNSHKRSLSNEDLFEDTILKSAKKLTETEEVKNDIDLNVIEALEQSEYSNTDINKTILEKINDLKQLSVPFIPNAPEPSKLNIWGFTSSTSDALTDKGFDWPTLFDGDSVTVDEGFSDYELISYQSQYGLLIADLPNYSSGEHTQAKGENYIAYKSLIRDLTAKVDEESPYDSRSNITPHLDKRWHLAAFMPDLNESEAAKDKENIRKAFIYGLSLGSIRFISEHNYDTFRYYGDSNRRLLIKNKEIEGRFSDLIEGLKYNPVIVAEVIEQYNKAVKADNRRNYSQPAKHRFYRGLAEPKDFVYRTRKDLNGMDWIVYTYADNPGGYFDDGDFDALLDTFRNVIEDFFRNVIDMQNDREAEIRMQKFISKLWKDSYYYSLQSSKNTHIYNIVENYIKRMKDEITGR